jgi:hypothetical protein
VFRVAPELYRRIVRIPATADGDDAISAKRYGAIPIGDASGGKMTLLGAEG